jgi:carboxylesterase type B
VTEATTTQEAPTARTASGDLRGRWAGEVAVFAGIPYAEAPVGDRRWAPPEPRAPWTGERLAREPGPVHPQPPARLEPVMGPMEAPPPGDDCLTLNIWTPAPASKEPLPVLVFIHGGGLLSHAGSASWYDGAVMARRGPAVVVTINYRLGALGYLYLPPEITGGDPIGNLGLQDQRLAVEWVRTNAIAFGGDPDNITVFGQSGGAHAIVAMQALGESRGLFRRAILQSPPLGMQARPPEEAQRTTEIFLEALGLEGLSMDQLRTADLGRIMDAQRQTLMQTARPGRIEPPFQLVVDGVVLSEEPMTAARSGSLEGIDLLMGITADEARAFYAFDDDLWSLSVDELAERIEASRGEPAATKLRALAEHSPGAPAAAALSDLVSDEIFIQPSIDLAESNPNPKGSLRFFRVSWRSDAVGGRLGACHTIELPFVFNNFAAWTNAPMLGSSAPTELQRLGDSIQDAWLAFATSGDPRHRGLDEWPTYTPDEPATMDFGESIQLIGDASEGRRRLWKD